MGILSRIKRLHIVAVGGVIFIALLVAFALAFLQPTASEIKDLQAQQQQQEQTWRQLPGAVSALGAAQEQLAQNKAAADKFMARMPKISLDPFEAMFDLHREYTSGIGPQIYQFFASRRYNVSGITIPASPLQPVDVPPMTSFPMGTFTLQAKSFPSIVTFLRQLKDMPLPGVVGTVRLGGTSPDLTANLPLTVYMVTQRAFTAAAAPAPTTAPMAGPGPGGGRMRIPGFGGG